MKKYIFLIVVMIGLSSCDNSYLDENPKGSITPANFYKTSSDLDMATAGLSTNFNGAFNQTGGLSITYGADDMSVQRAGNKAGLSDFDTFQATSSNDRMIVWWKYFYSTIKSSNALIKNYPNAVEATESQRNSAGGYAYFMRALSYFFLTRTWGAVPLPTEAIVYADLPNSEPADVYALIVEDLKKAETMLPDHWDGVKVQNGVDVFATKGSAKALLANVYLTMAGWPLKQTDKYALAAAKAKEVIDSKVTWGYNLEPNSANLFDILYKFNHETVFGCYYNNKAPSSDWENGSQMGPNTFAPEDEGGWSDGYGEIAFYNKFPAGPRKDATYQTVYFLNGNPNTPGDYTQILRKHPYFLKYRFDDSYDKATHTAANWWGSMTVPVIRYAEVLLTYAEAKAMSANPDATAYAAINEVRTRAGLPNLAAGLSQTNFRDAVIAERGWEFAGGEPASRWFDLIRTETVAKVLTDRDASEVPLINTPNDVSHTYYWAPIPIVK
jgi:hypothetical protein